MCGYHCSSPMPLQSALKTESSSNTRKDHITCSSSLQQLCASIHPGPDARLMCLVLSLRETLHTHPHRDVRRQTWHDLPQVTESERRALRAPERALFPPLYSSGCSPRLLPLKLKIFPGVTSCLTLTVCKGAVTFSEPLIFIPPDHRGAPGHGDCVHTMCLTKGLRF